ncbi:hypothetical protein KBTX_04256 [wastewater metagenome]|uniref:Uncharacterized protein n=2 Tax=unclassified sequences TaxID=12908 RepID=A0A5B8RG87_9ZZZZ|nr:hypothetical protein KBTEX_04256 [uncultured organism]
MFGLKLSGTEGGVSSRASWLWWNSTTCMNARTAPSGVVYVGMPASANCRRAGTARKSPTQLVSTGLRPRRR